MVMCYKHKNDWCCGFFFFFNDTATTEIYTLSLHDALPILIGAVLHRLHLDGGAALSDLARRKLLDVRIGPMVGDRKSTRLNSSHANISYAVFCLKKKKTILLLFGVSIPILLCTIRCLYPQH